MRILYIFPHPDDESFGPAPVIKRQVEEGHEVFLLTLTRGDLTINQAWFALLHQKFACLHWFRDFVGYFKKKIWTC